MNWKVKSMTHLKLAEEKAAEWGVTPQHVQRLCRGGKVIGAVKRAGIWFIPDDTPNPLKNSKSSDQSFKFVGTKMKVFECAISLFKENGFENVTVQDIADCVGIRQSAVYNHFRSKQELLDTIYEFYSFYYLLNRPSLESLDPILREGSLFDIINSVHYEFDGDIRGKMLDITKIVHHRIYVDSRARQLIKTLSFDEGVRYVEAVFQRAMDQGRIAPMDKHLMAIFINGVRTYTLQGWVIDPSNEHMNQMVADERALYERAAKLLTDLKPPAETGC